MISAASLQALSKARFISKHEYQVLPDGSTALLPSSVQAARHGLSVVLDKIKNKPIEPFLTQLLDGQKTAEAVNEPMPSASLAVPQSPFPTVVHSQEDNQLLLTVLLAQLASEDPSTIQWIISQVVLSENILVTPLLIQTFETTLYAFKQGRLPKILALKRKPHFNAKACLRILEMLLPRREMDDAAGTFPLHQQSSTGLLIQEKEKQAARCSLELKKIQYADLMRHRKDLSNPADYVIKRAALGAMHTLIMKLPPSPDLLNLNCKITVGGELFVCRHACVAAILYGFDIIENCFSTREGITQFIQTVQKEKSCLEVLCLEAKAKTRSIYIGNPTQFGKYLAFRLEHLATRLTLSKSRVKKTVLVFSPEHVMAFELQARCLAGQCTYKVKSFDPNFLVGRSVVFCSSAEGLAAIREKTLGNFIGRAAEADYFPVRDRKRIPFRIHEFSSTSILPTEMVPIYYISPTGEMLSAPTRLNTTIMYYVIAGGFLAGFLALLPSLERLPASQRQKIIAAHWESSGLYIALHDGRIAVVRAVLEAVHRYNLFPEPQAFFEFILALYSSSSLEVTIPGLWAAVYLSHTDAVVVVLDSIADYKGSLPSEWFSRLFKHNSGISWLVLSMQDETNKAVYTFLEAATRSTLFKKRPELLFELLAYKDKLGCTAFDLAISQGNVCVVNALRNTVLAASFTEEQKKQLLGPYYQAQDPLPAFDVITRT